MVHNVYILLLKLNQQLIEPSLEMMKTPELMPAKKLMKLMA